MPALAPTQQYGEIVWLGRVPVGAGLRSRAVQELVLTYAGADGVDICRCGRRGP